VTFQDGLPTPRRHFSALAVGLAIAMAVLDGTIANVALPTIAADLGVSAADSVWIINAYQLSIVICLLPMAALGDKLGYRRVYLLGLGIFTLGSLACALSNSLETLVAARVLQGIGAGATMSNSSALVRFTYPAQLIGRGLAINTIIIAISAAAGPSIAAAVLAVAPWPFLFAISVPIGLIAMAIGLRCLPATIGSGRRFDAVAALLNGLTFGLIILGAEMLAREQFMPGAAAVAAGAAAGGLLVRRELRAEAPLVPFDLMRIPIFALSIATSVASFAGQMLAFVALPFYFQRELGLSAVAIGLLITPWPIGVGIASPIAGRLAGRFSSGLLGGIGLGLFALGLGLIALLPEAPSQADIAWRMLLCGLGFGFFQTPNNRTIITTAPHARSGAAGGMLSMARLLGQTAGATTMAMFFHLSDGDPTRLALTVAAGLAAIGALVSLLRLRQHDGPAPDPGVKGAGLDG